MCAHFIWDAWVQTMNHKKCRREKKMFSYTASNMKSANMNIFTFTRTHVDCAQKLAEKHYTTRTVIHESLNIVCVGGGGMRNWISFPGIRTEVFKKNSVSGGHQQAIYDISWSKE